MTRQSNLNYIIQTLSEAQNLIVEPATDLADQQRQMRALMNTCPPIDLPEAYYEAQDQELQIQLAERGVVDIDDIPRCSCTLGGLSLLLWQGDITRLRVDCITNAANSQLLGCFSPLHSCIDNCIHSAAGLQLRMACHEHMQLQQHPEPTGQAHLTEAYNLPSRYVVHTVGPIVDTTAPTEVHCQQLADCYLSCLRAADDAGCGSLALCCISTGVFRFPNRQAAEIAIRTVRSFRARQLKTVVFNVFLDKDYTIYSELLNT